tara:strand:- start:37 stop:555 length:519 start_codon:yes stop_codon:yes gene_type:complete
MTRSIQDITRSKIKFADTVFRKFRSVRYGMTPCCIDDYDNVVTEYNICEWLDSKVLVRDIIKVVSSIVSNPNNPSSSDEYLQIVVIDADGDAMKDFEIYINNEKIGKTDVNGHLNYTLENASLITSHTLNFCHCFTTIGFDRTQKLVVTVSNDPDKLTCISPEITCTNATSS